MNKLCRGWRPRHPEPENEIRRGRCPHRPVKKILSMISFLAIFVVLTVCVHAAEFTNSGECGAHGNNLIWTLDSEGTLRISGKGDMADYDFSGPWREGVINVIIGDGVTNIGKNAFNYIKSMEKITIPDNVKSIGRCAFWGCSNLKTVSIENGTTDIGYAAFNMCSSLKSIALPDSVTTLGDWVFW